MGGVRPDVKEYVKQLEQQVYVARAAVGNAEQKLKGVNAEIEAARARLSALEDQLDRARPLTERRRAKKVPKPRPGAATTGE